MTMRDPPARAPRISLAEIAEIELRLLKRVRELTLGDHASLLHGPGADFVGLRDWQAGDRFEAIDWPQSSLTNFSPLVVREFEQASTASVVMLADVSLSTHFGGGAAASGAEASGAATSGATASGAEAFEAGNRVAGARGAAGASGVAGADGTGGARGVSAGVGGADRRSAAEIIARAVATIGLSAVFFQDAVGLVTFDGACEHLRGLRPRVGKPQVIHCLDALQDAGASAGAGHLAQAGRIGQAGDIGHGHARHAGQAGGGAGLLETLRHADSLSATLAGFLRKTSLVPVISDFLFDAAPSVIAELSRLDAVHDVCIALVDAGAAFELPPLSAGWVETFDAETGRRRLLSRGELSRMAARVRAWQADVARQAKAAGLDVVRLVGDPGGFELALAEFVVERRLRRI